MKKILKHFIRKFVLGRKLLMPYTLVVVDMQEEFTAARDTNTIIECEELILEAISDHATIVFLEFTGCGRTMDSLYELVDNHYNVFFLRKSGCDGSNHIMRNNKAFELQEIHFKVCGVNTDACVQDTVLGLSSKYPEAVIEVISSACNSEVSHLSGLATMALRSNVVITESSLAAITEETKLNVN